MILSTISFVLKITSLSVTSKSQSLKSSRAKTPGRERDEKLSSQVNDTRILQEFFGDKR